MNRIVTDAAALVGAVFGFVGAWICIVAFVACTGVPFGVPGLVLVSVAGVAAGVRVSRRLSARYVEGIR